MRVLRVVLVGLIAVIACGANTSFAPLPVPPPELRDVRAGIIRRDIAFAHDTIPLLRFDVPPIYGAIRVAVTKCLGLDRAGWPTFYVAPMNPLPGHVLAFYTESSRSVVFALGMESVAETVTHELIHWFLAPHVNPFRRADESYAQWVERTHPDTIYGRGDTPGKCAHLLYPGT